MKVGTDGVLLGAWVSLKHQPDSILDIGAGTGLIALMLGQRSTAETIDAIEVDENAYEQCVGNFEISSWNDRLFCYHAGLDEFMEEIECQYDLIVSNPPFYSEEVSIGNIARDIARQNRSLPFNELLGGVSKLLEKDGVFSIIIPYKEEEMFIVLAEEFGLFTNRIMRVKGNPSVETKRSLLEFCFKKTNASVNELIIEQERHRYTADYIALTNDFYIKM